MVECCQFDKAKVIVSVKTPRGGYLAEIGQVASCPSNNNMNCSIHNARIMRPFFVHTLILHVCLVYQKIALAWKLLKAHNFKSKPSLLFLNLATDYKLVPLLWKPVQGPLSCQK